MKRLSGHTTPYAVLGHPIGHSLSPVMHNAGIEELGMDAIYLAFDVHPDRLMEVLTSMADMGFGGVNLTVPLKEVAFRGLDDLDDSARRVGAVNTVEFTDRGLRGHNTDGQGFLLAVKESFDAEISGMSVLVLGCGGAGRALAITCAAEKAGRLFLTDVDAGRSQRVASEIETQFPGVKVEAMSPQQAAWVRASQATDLVIQATPVGMKPGQPSLLPPEAFRQGQLVFDLIYMFPQTPLLKTAAEAGARTANGLGMLLHQGAWAFTIWTGRQAAVGAMRQALESEVYKD